MSGPPREPMFPARNLIPYIRRAALDYAEPDVGDEGIRKLSRHIAAVRGRVPESEGRMIQRILGGHTSWLQLPTADELAIALGASGAEVWPDEWFRASRYWTEDEEGAA